MSPTKTKTLSAILFVYLFYLGLCSFFTFRPDWDFLAYHLPHALALFNLTSFTNGPFLEAVNAGMPPLAHLAQGLLVYLTGRFSSANFINFLALLGLLAYGKKRLHFDKERLSLFALLTLSIPLAHIHATAGYIDLWSNSAITISTLETLYWFNKSDRKIKPIPLLFCFSLFVAFFSRFQMWPICVLLSLLYYYHFVREADIAPLKKVVTGLLLMLIIGTWPMRNILKFHNPMYPLAIPGLTNIFPNHALDTNKIMGQIPLQLANTPQPIRFLYSAFELSRFSSRNPLAWSLDQYADGGENNPHHRLGGWNILTMLILCTLLFRLTRNQRPILITFSCLIVITSLTPQSHELRYWLYIPLTMAFLAVAAFPNFKGGLIKSMLLTLIIGNFLLVSAKVSPRLSFVTANDYAPEKAKVFWATASKHERYKLCELPNTIFFSGPRFNDFMVTDCH